jgi:hypothetical protein
LRKKLRSVRKAGEKLDVAAQHRGEKAR